MSDFLPANNRHYISMLKPIYEARLVPELFREKLGRVYSVTEDNSQGEELIPSIKDYLALKSIPVREFEATVLFGIPMLSLSEVREGEAIHHQLEQEGLLEPNGIWLLTPVQAEAYVAERANELS
jgi:hypothetical protein